MKKVFLLLISMVVFAFSAFAIRAEESKESVPAEMAPIKLACKSLEAARLASEGFLRLLTLDDVSSKRLLSEEEQAEQQGILNAFPLMILSQTCSFVREEDAYISQEILEERGVGSGRVTIEKAQLTAYVVTVAAPRASDEPTDNTGDTPLPEGEVR